MVVNMVVVVEVVTMEEVVELPELQLVVVEVIFYFMIDFLF
jgi:hypothetical protein